MPERSFSCDWDSTRDNNYQSEPFAPAIHELAVLYEHGVGVQPDDEMENFHSNILSTASYGPIRYNCRARQVMEAGKNYKTVVGQALSEDRSLPNSALYSLWVVPDAERLL